MGTRLRSIIHVGGEYRGGGMARLTLESYAAKMGPYPERGSMPEEQRLIELFKRIPREAGIDLWLFREPRDTDSAKSRFARLADYCGVRPRKRSFFSPDIDLAAEQRRWVRSRPATQPTLSATRTVRYQPLDVPSSEEPEWTMAPPTGRGLTLTEMLQQQQMREQVRRDAAATQERVVRETAERLAESQRRIRDSQQYWGDTQGPLGQGLTGALGQTAPTAWEQQYPGNPVSTNAVPTNITYVTQGTATNANDRDREYEYRPFPDFTSFVING